MPASCVAGWTRKQSSRQIPTRTARSTRTNTYRSSSNASKPRTRIMTAPSMPRSSLRRQARLSGGCCNRSSLPDVAAVLTWPLNQGLWRTIRRGYAAARTCNGRTRPNRGWSYTAEALLRPAPCSDEHRTWRVYHGQSRFGLRWVPHADSGQPRAAGFELAGF